MISLAPVLLGNREKDHSCAVSKPPPLIRFQCGDAQLQS